MLCVDFHILRAVQCRLHRLAGGFNELQMSKPSSDLTASVHDYLVQQGFTKAAAALLKDAGVPKVYTYASITSCNDACLTCACMDLV